MNAAADPRRRSVLRRPRLVAGIAVSLVAVVLSAVLYVGFFVSIGDPLAMLGSAHGNWEAIRPYYKPVLAAAAFCLALVLPELSPLSGLLFVGVQVVACFTCDGLTAASGHEWWTNAMWPLAMVMVPIDVATWVVPAMLLAVVVRLGPRLAAARGGAP